MYWHAWEDYSVRWGTREQEAEIAWTELSSIPKNGTQFVGMELSSIRGNIKFPRLF
jgi:hypothetical protein